MCHSVGQMTEQSCTLQMFLLIGSKFVMSMVFGRNLGCSSEIKEMSKKRRFWLQVLANDSTICLLILWKLLNRSYICAFMTLPDLLLMLLFPFKIIYLQYLYVLVSKKKKKKRWK